MASRAHPILMTYDGRTLLPYAPYDRERLEHLPMRKPVRVVVTASRSLPMHRLYWAVLRAVVKNTDLFASERDLHDLLLVGCGVTRKFVDLDGNISQIPCSIAFEAMDQEQFRAYFDKAMLIVVTRIVPGTDLKALLSEGRTQSGPAIDA